MTLLVPYRAVSRHLAHCPEKHKPRPVSQPGFTFGRPNETRTNLLGVGSLDARAVDQLDVRHRRIVARTEAALEDTQIAAGTLAVTRAQFDKQLAHSLLVAQTGKRQTTVGDAE